MSSDSQFYFGSGSELVKIPEFVKFCGQSLVIVFLCLVSLLCLDKKDVIIPDQARRYLKLFRFD